MASRIEFSVSMTPIKTIAASGDAPAVDVISTDINKSLGGSGSVTNSNNNDLTTAGYSSGTASYLGASTAGVNLYNAAKDFVFVKNTGLKNSDGTATSNDVQILPVVEQNGETVTTPLFTLKKDEGMVLPRCLVSNSLVMKVKSSGSDTVRVEYVAVTI